MKHQKLFIIITKKRQETKQRFESVLNNEINIITISPGKKIEEIFNLITCKNIKNMITDFQIDVAVTMIFTMMC